MPLFAFQESYYAMAKKACFQINGSSPSQAEKSLASMRLGMPVGFFRHFWTSSQTW
jgi:hypothetical protein